MKKFKLSTIGTEGLSDEETINRVIIVNRLCLATALSIVVIGIIIGEFTNWKASILVPLGVEFLINSLVLYFNAKRRPLTAAFILYYLQCIVIIYYGLSMGRLLQLDLVIVLLFAVAYLIFRKKWHRLLAVGAAITDLIVLEIIYHHSPQQANIPISPEGAYIVRLLVIVAVISIILMVSRPYVLSNDLRYELKRANHFIRIFTAQVTHELRNNIDSIHQATQLLKRETRENNKFVQLKPLIDISYIASCDARNTINNVLDLAEIESGKTPAAAREHLEIKKLIEDVIEVNKVLAQKKQIKLELYFEMPEIIISDPLHLKQILSNLIGNAIKYSFKGTSVNIAAKRTDTRNWELRVSNLGKGIPKEKTASLFDPFITWKTGFTQGTGLGLYIVKNKVLALGGEISVESKSGGYTLFTVSFPLQEGNRSFLACPEGDDVDLLRDLNNIHVMIAEDRGDAAFLLLRSLKDMGCKITLVNNGLELLHAAQKDCPDVIILDCYMPILNGEDTILRLKKDPELSFVPIIAITGDFSPEHVDRILQAGASAFLKKPIDHVTLERAIKLYSKN